MARRRARSSGGPQTAPRVEFARLAGTGRAPIASVAKQKTKKSKPYQKTSRCWPGYAPVPGRRPHEEGSCRKLPASRNAGVEVDRRTARQAAERAATSERERAEIRTKSSSARERDQARRTLARLDKKAATKRGAKSARPKSRAPRR